MAVRLPVQTAAALVNTVDANVTAPGCCHTPDADKRPEEVLCSIGVVTPSHLLPAIQ